MATQNCKQRKTKQSYFTNLTKNNKNIMNKDTLLSCQTPTTPSKRSKTLKMNTNTKQIAKQRIQTLFHQAEEARKGNPQLASRYVELARKIAMAAKIRLPPEYKRRICRNCNTLLVPGENCRVRIKQRREPHVAVTCLACGHQTRVLLKKKKGEKET
jgi:ribonuclease P protein subunit RPR2